jgi:hypothetical protein
MDGRGYPATQVAKTPPGWQITGQCKAAQALLIFVSFLEGLFRSIGIIRAMDKAGGPGLRPPMTGSACPPGLFDGGYA